MRVVVDASVAAKWYFPEPGRAAADALLEGAAAGRHDLLAPDLVAAELPNVLWKKVRREECDEETAREILDLWEVDRPRLVASDLLAPRALDLAFQLELSVYDALYLAAAIEFEAALATADGRLARAARSVLAEVLAVED